MTSREREREQLLARILTRLDAAYAKALGEGASRRASIILNARNHTARKNFVWADALSHMKYLPAPIEEFLDSPEFLGGHVEVWPALRDTVTRMNPDQFIGEAPIFETLLGGATGTGKTHVSSINVIYSAYILSCFNKPQRLFPGLDTSTPLLFLLQAVSGTMTKRAIYRPIRHIWTNMEFVRRWVPWNKQTESELQIDQNIVIAPALANIGPMLGQAVIGAILDEVNFMQVVSNSKKTAGPTGEGGHFDQAEEVHRTLARRRKSRFTTPGPSPGCICAISSTRYKDDYLDRRIEQVQKHGEPNVLVLKKKQYDVVPPERYCGERFPVLIGTEAYPTRVLDSEEDAIPEGGEIEMVPVENRFDFLNDPDNALRDIVGIATGAIKPWISQRHKIIAAVERGKQYMQPFVTKMDVDYAQEGLPQIVEELLPPMEDRQNSKHFIHIDLSLSQDRAGICMVRHTGFTNRGSRRPDGQLVQERVPTFSCVLSLSIKPSAIKQLDIGEIRTWVMQLATFWGFNVYSITMDGFQSAESFQAFRRLGVKTWLVSVDKTTEPYEYVRRALYQDRLDILDHEMLQRELRTLEFDEHKGKVDHTPRGSKDVADALTGAVYGAAHSRFLRRQVTILDEQGVDVVTEMNRERLQGAKYPEEREDDRVRRRTDPWGQSLGNPLQFMDG